MRKWIELRNIPTGGVTPTDDRGGIPTGDMLVGGLLTGGIPIGGIATGGMLTGGMPTGGIPPITPMALVATVFGGTIGMLVPGGVTILGAAGMGGTAGRTAGVIGGMLPSGCDITGRLVGTGGITGFDTPGTAVIRKQETKLSNM